MDRHTQLHMYACTRACAYTHTHTHIHTHTHTHIHTHTHTLGSEISTFEHSYIHKHTHTGRWYYTYIHLQFMYPAMKSSFYVLYNLELHRFDF